MADSPAEYIAKLEAALRSEVSARKAAAATAAIAIGRLQEAEKVVQHLRSALAHREIHWSDVEVLLSQYDAHVRSTTGGA